VIFLDTSAIYALADRGDPNHRTALRRFEAILEAGAPLLTHNYVLLESIALVQHRLGAAAALKLAHEATAFVVEWVDEPTHRDAVAALARRDRRQVSLVDAVSFLVMRRRGVRKAFAIDPHFSEEGFEIVG
jgi:predicted nucleic acid-binding protein